MPIVAKSQLRRAASPAPIRRPEIQPRARVRRPAASVATPVPVVARDLRSAPSVTAPAAKGSYEVGYGKPPKHSQFKKGQSGNKKGRPKGARGLKTIARELLSEKVMVRTTAGLKRMRKIEAMVHKVMEKAFAGDMRAIQSLLQLYASAVPDEPLLTQALADIPVIHSDEHDKAILDALRRTLREGDDDREPR